MYVVKRGTCMQDVVTRFAPPPVSQHAGLDVNLTPYAVQMALQCRCAPPPTALDISAAAHVGV